MSGTGDAPLIRCECGEDVEEHEYIDELKMCKVCYEDAYGGNFVSIDQAEIIKGDR